MRGPDGVPVACVHVSPSSGDDQIAPFASPTTICPAAGAASALTRPNAPTAFHDCPLSVDRNRPDDAPEANTIDAFARDTTTSAMSVRLPNAVGFHDSP